MKVWAANGLFFPSAAIGWLILLLQRAKKRPRQPSDELWQVQSQSADGTANAGGDVWGDVAGVDQSQS